MSGVNEVLSGSVSAIMNFGAFISLEDGSTGLVHISEISKSFVKDVNDFLSVGQQVRVVAMATDHDGKKRLSMKKADEILTENGDPNVNVLKVPSKGLDVNQEKKQDKPKKNRVRKPDDSKVSKQDLYSQPPPEFDDLRSSSTDDFEDRLSKYMKLSEERLIDVKRQSENKRGGGYVRRG
ncbi:MAG: S1 RNA-binding domain-containing protein [Clostridia bacterium]|nr:S1 RNA-binding domain-containing protein [Clostridia bacterium]